MVHNVKVGLGVSDPNDFKNPFQIQFSFYLLYLKQNKNLGLIFSSQTYIFFNVKETLKHWIIYIIIYR